MNARNPVHIATGAQPVEDEPRDAAIDRLQSIEPSAFGEPLAAADLLRELGYVAGRTEPLHKEK